MAVCPSALLRRWSLEDAAAIIATAASGAALHRVGDVTYGIREDWSSDAASAWLIDAVTSPWAFAITSVVRQDIDAPRLVGGKL